MGWASYASVIERKYELTGGAFRIDEDDSGLVVGTSYYGSKDEKEGREFLNWSARWRRVRVFISKANQFDTINSIQTPHRCLITLGFNPLATPPAMWTELVCDTGDPDWVGSMWAPERNWLETLVPAELGAGEFTVEFYGQLLNVHPETQALRRGRQRRVLRKLWQCPGRFLARIQVPHLMALPGFPKIGADFEMYYAAAASETKPAGQPPAPPRPASAGEDFRRPQGSAR